ncbi:uncharacterized protein A4U43_C08F25260 [Asparagus officinalis]|uniref:ATP-dependent DNA helicase Q-like SIM n=1 Tax=Asparagus officinalis TaxID=4686 RepID=UPI00098E79E5|nr:ATP-dependent DNA helicase Q-like SIM [Asparagus officinalis]XP_020244622.1 ATP-dependent DNA helicase Q-like SIM [Asparagus officinalis]XP_020244623.1 ATP-dependent DNA helicase Q-like SIM [Asparagus officinalis]ONK61020.1 uncharacterized protein A4U43_C08F25260 [Asparagus officinalis]
MSGMYRIIYVCPETVLRLTEPLTRLAESHGIALFAIDEVHCVSKWGHDFRPDYRQLSILRKNFSSCNLKFLKFDIPLMALTATATIPVREDIIKSLHMSEETKIVLTSFFRPNVRFSGSLSVTCDNEVGICSSDNITPCKRNLLESDIEHSVSVDLISPQMSSNKKQKKFKIERENYNILRDFKLLFYKSLSDS